MIFCGGGNRRVLMFFLGFLGDMAKDYCNPFSTLIFGKGFTSLSKLHAFTKCSPDRLLYAAIFKRVLDIIRIKTNGKALKKLDCKWTGNWRAQSNKIILREHNIAFFLQKEGVIMNIFCYARVTVGRMNTKCCYAQDNRSIEISIAIYTEL